MPSIVTKTDPLLDRGILRDDVIGLWRGNANLVHELEKPGEYVVGSASQGVWLRLDDAKGRISQRHALIAVEAFAPGSMPSVRVTIRDLRSKNGITVDGAACTEAALEPCSEIMIGGVRLIAESKRSAVVRAYLQRVLGWRAGRAVERGLRSVRATLTKRVPLMLCGKSDDLVAIAQSLHRRMFGVERSFIVCDSERERADANIRNPTNYPLGMQALGAAAGGSLCLWLDKEKRPRDFAKFGAALADPECPVHQFRCSRNVPDEDPFALAPEPIVVPSLTTRAHEMARLVDDYALDAAADLGIPPRPLGEAERKYIVTHETGSLAEIETATLRIRALQLEGGNVKRAAERLGMSRESLRRWVRRRKLPFRIDEES